MKQVVIFGGTGFIGTHLAQTLLKDPSVELIVLADIRPPRQENYAAALNQALATGRARYIEFDVRKPVPLNLFPAAPDVIFNLAAIHREPGHQPAEYYETNLAGSENVCDYASATACKRVVFTSSISPYGPTEDSKSEQSLPVPETPYGGSKLVAEKMHTAWQMAGDDRKLLILRPGVVFGPGEGGNVTRLVRSLVKGYFVYMGNKSTRKAGGYVKELCYVMLFGLKYQDEAGEPVTILNFSMDPTRSLEEFVNTIRKVAGIRRKPMTVPRSFLLGISYPIEAVASIFGIKQPISPVRVRKLFRSTNIEPQRLRELHYPYHFTLETAFEDWKIDKPEDFIA